MLFQSAKKLAKKFNLRHIYHKLTGRQRHNLNPLGDIDTDSISIDHLVKFYDDNPPIYSRDFGKGKNIKFFCNSLIPLNRARSLLEAEPETNRWIDSFEENSVFWDIGTNVGTYSLYAATIKKNIRVFSFEPFAANFFLLNKNIEINQLDKKITAYPIAIAGQSKVDLLYMKNTSIGSAENQFATSIDPLGKNVSSFFQQGAVGYSMDDLVSVHNIPFPNYIKIDVDGLEEEIIFGSKAICRDKRLKSILVELSKKKQDELNRVSEFIVKNGFTLGSVSPSETNPENQKTHDNYQFIFSR